MRMSATKNVWRKIGPPDPAPVSLRQHPAVASLATTITTPRISISKAPAGSGMPMRCQSSSIRHFLTSLPLSMLAEDTLCCQICFWQKSVWPLKEQPHVDQRTAPPLHGHRPCYLPIRPHAALVLAIRMERFHTLALRLVVIPCLPRKHRHINPFSRISVKVTSRLSIPATGKRLCGGPRSLCSRTWTSWW